MTVNVLVPVAVEPLSLTETKAHMRVDYPDEDSYITMLISEAREYGEQYCRRSFCPQTLQALLQVPLLPAGMISGPIGWRPSQIEVPMPPVTNISLLEGEFSPGLFQSIDAANYVVDLASTPAYIYLLSSAYSFLSSQWSLWIGPYTPRFRVTYTAGYTVLPFMLKRALIELVAYWYAYREGRDEGRSATKTSIPEGIQDKFDRYKVWY